VTVARGEFVAFLDDDDEWIPDKVEKQMGLFRESPDIGLVYSGWAWINGDSGRIELARIPDERGLICAMPRWAYNIAVDFAVRRDIFSRVLFHEGIRHMENCDVLMRIAQICRFSYLREVTVICTSHGEERASDSAADRAAGILYILHKHQSFLQAYPKVRARLYLALGALNLRRFSQRTESRTFLKAAIASRPFQGKAWAYFLMSFMPDCVLDKWAKSP
jgi:glycosyltransferase involved in cell wall biosynthesis